MPMPAYVDRTALLLSVPVAAVSVVIAVVSLPPGPVVVATTGVFLAHVGLVLRRSAPGTAYVVVAAGVLTMALATGLFVILPSTLTFPVAVHAAAAFGGGRGRVAVPVTAVVAAALATWRLVTDYSVRAQGLAPSPPLVLTVFLAVLLAAWSLGLRTRADRELARALAERAQEREAAAALAERTRIAREMHDVLAHSLAAVISQAKGGQYAALTDPAASTRALNAIEHAGRQAAQELRGLLGLLDVPTTAARVPPPGLADLSDLIEQFGRARLLETGRARPLPPAAQLAVYRVVQESLTNVTKHAGDGVRATVHLTWEAARLTVAVRDSGHGRRDGHGRARRVALGDDTAGMGIAGMRHRVVALGGDLQARDRPDGGFEVTAWLPCPPEGAA